MLERRHSPGKDPADAAPGDTAPSASMPGNGAPSAWRDPWTWGIASVVFGAYLVISLYRLWTLTPSSWDLGIYTEYVKQWAHLRVPVVDVRGPGFNLLGDHFQVIVALIAPFFRLFPTPVTLLTAQALLTALSVFPVVQAATVLLGPASEGGQVGSAAGGWVGPAAGGWVGAGERGSPGDRVRLRLLLGPAADDRLRLPRDRLRGAAPGVLVVGPRARPGARDDLLGAADGLGQGGPGLHHRGDRRPDVAGERPRGWGTAPGRGGPRIAASTTGGVFLACWGVACSLIEISWVIPRFSATHRYAYWNLGGVVGGSSAFSAGGLLVQVGHAYPTKLETLVLLLLPTAFIALGSPLAAVVVPSILLRFIATNPYYWGTMWHYNATAMPILFIAAIEAMARWRWAAGAGRPAPGRWPLGDGQAGLGRSRP